MHWTPIDIDIDADDEKPGSICFSSYDLGQGSTRWRDYFLIAPTRSRDDFKCTPSQT